jgi:hypothetical protein
MPKKKTDDEVPEPEVVEEQSPQVQELPEQPQATDRPQYRDPTEQQARDMVSRLSPAGVALLQRELGHGRLGRDRRGRNRL